MKRNMLILVHVEDSFRKFFPKMYVQRLIRSCKSSKYNKIIHMTSHIDSDEPIKEIRKFIDQEIDWAWGYEPFFFEDDEDEKCWVVEHGGIHEYTWVPPEFRNNLLSNYNVFLGGGYHGECLADMEEVLKYLETNYTLVHGLVY